MFVTLCSSHRDAEQCDKTGGGGAQVTDLLGDFRYAKGSAFSITSCPSHFWSLLLENVLRLPNTVYFKTALILTKMKKYFTVIPSGPKISCWMGKFDQQINS